MKRSTTDGRATMKGFTLLETLVALAVFGIFLTGLLQAEQSYRRAAASEDRALRGQQRQAAIELLRAEIAMAGYGHQGDDIWASSERGTDRVSFVYLEDRLATEPTLRTVAFDAGLDAAGRASLYRKEGTGYRQPAVLGVRELRVVGWVDAAGERRATPGASVSAIVLELVFAWGERVRIAVGLRNAATYASSPSS